MRTEDISICYDDEHRVWEIVGDSTLDGCEGERTLTRAESLTMAHQSLKHFPGRVGTVRVYWHGSDESPLEWTATELEDETAE